MTDMTWVTADDIQAACGISLRTFRRIVNEPAWPVGQRTGLGGTLRWAISDLPEYILRRGQKVLIRQTVASRTCAQAAIVSREPTAALGRVETRPTAGCVTSSCRVETRPTEVTHAPVNTPLTALAGEPDADHAGLLMGSRLPTAADFARLQKARVLLLALQPLLELPARHKGRRAMAEQVGIGLGLSYQQVYRLAARATTDGLLGLARMGLRADKGQARVVISAAWLRLAEAVVRDFPAVGGVDVLALRTLEAVRAAWAAGAPSVRQAWLKAQAACAKHLYESGVAREYVAQWLNLPCPRRFVEAEGQYFRVAATALRDAKRCYDVNITGVKRTAAGYAPGDLVCGDVSPLDIPVARPDGSTAYARMISWHDVATNWLWVDLFLVQKGEGVRREHVAASFAKMCETAPFGAPRALYLDNGSEYKWEEMLFAWSQLAMLTGQRFRADEAALLPSSGRLVRSIPFHPRGKRIEGQFGNLHQWLGWWFGYVGGNRMAKKITSLGKAPVISDFDAVSAWLAATLADYHSTPQPRAEAMQGMSPQGRMDHFLNMGFRPSRIDRMALMLAFADRDTRKVVRGAINWQGRTFTADFLMGISGRVQVAFPRIGGGEFDVLIVLDGKGGALGVAFPERSFGILDGAGAQEAGRRRQAFKVLVADKIKQAGEPLDEVNLAGFRAEMLGLNATLEQAAAAATTVEPAGELAEMARVYAEARAQMSAELQAVMARSQAANEAESLIRMAFEDEDTKLARALGF